MIQFLLGVGTVFGVVYYFDLSKQSQTRKYFLSFCVIALAIWFLIGMFVNGGETAFSDRKLSASMGFRLLNESLYWLLGIGEYGQFFEASSTYETYKLLVSPFNFLLSIFAPFIELDFKKAGDLENYYFHPWIHWGTTHTSAGYSLSWYFQGVSVYGFLMLALDSFGFIDISVMKPSWLQPKATKSNHSSHKASTRYCSQCGNSVNANEIFCRNCGSEISN